MPVRIYLTDPVCLEVEGRVFDDWRRVGRQGRLIFAILVAEHLRPVAVDELAEELWPDQLPASSERTLSALVSKLRSLLDQAGIPGASLINAFASYQLRLPGDAVIDIETAVEAIDRAEGLLRAANHGEAVGWAWITHQVLRRPFLVGEDGPWATRKRAELTEVLFRAHECLSELFVWNGEPAMAVWHAEHAIAMEPYRESAYQHLMRAQAASGNRALAFKTYERCRCLLIDELGVSPSPETEAVYRQILEA